MTDYTLIITNTRAAGGRHWYGQVTEDREPGDSYGAGAPRRVSWQVDADWTPARLARWRIRDHKKDVPGPHQFETTDTLIMSALRQFIAGVTDADLLWEGAAEVTPAGPGDRLWFPDQIYPRGGLIAEITPQGRPVVWWLTAGLVARGVSGEMTMRAVRAATRAATP